MNRIRALDATNYTMTVEAGCKLASLYAAPEAADRLFPLGLTAIAPHCEIGGNLSTNAGGINVLRYGTARNLVLGLEVVLPDGRIWDGLRSLRKDNTGYDLKQLFIGAEGTLGIITAAVVKLYPLPKSVATACVAIRDPAVGVALLAHLRATCGDTINAFELISRSSLDLVFKNIADTHEPFRTKHEWLVITQLADVLPEPLDEALARCDQILRRKHRQFRNHHRQCPRRALVEAAQEYCRGTKDRRPEHQARHFRAHQPGWGILRASGRLPCARHFRAFASSLSDISGMATSITTHPCRMPRKTRRLSNSMKAKCIGWCMKSWQNSKAASPPSTAWGSSSAKKSHITRVHWNLS